MKRNKLLWFYNYLYALSTVFSNYAGNSVKIACYSWIVFYLLKWSNFFEALKEVLN